MSAAPTFAPPSIPPTTWTRIVRDLDIPPALRFLALVLASFADADGRRVRLTRAALVQIVGGSDRRVKDQLRELRRLGFLHTFHSPTGPGDAAEYHLTLPLDLPGPRDGFLSLASRSRPHYSTPLKIAASA